MKKLNRQFFVIVIIAIILCVLFLIYQLSQANKINVRPSDRPLIENNAIEIPIDSTDPIIGNQGAPFTLTAFFDFNDPANRDLYKEINAFINQHPTRIRMIFKDFPATGLFAEDNMKPHIAAFCAKKQNKFIEFASELSKLKGKTTNNATLSQVASSTGMQKTSWDACFDSNEAKIKIESSISLAKSIGLKKAPAIFVNNRLINYLDEIDINEFLTELIKEYQL